MLEKSSHTSVSHSHYLLFPIISQVYLKNVNAAALCCSCDCALQLCDHTKTQENQNGNVSPDRRGKMPQMYLASTDKLT